MGNNGELVDSTQVELDEAMKTGHDEFPWDDPLTMVESFSVDPLRHGKSLSKLKY